MGDWENMQFDDLATLEYGRALPSEIRTGSGYPVIGSSGLTGRHSRAFVNGPGIIIGRKGTVGSIVWSDEPSWPIDTTYWIQPRRELSLRWLYWVLQILGLNRMDSSTGVPGLNRNDVYNVFLPVPPLTEQQRIAEILDAVDDSIQTHQKIVDKLSLAGGRLVDRFFLELVEGCPASAVDYKTIEAIGAHHRAFLKTGPFGSSLKGDDWVEQGVPVVTIGSLRDGLISEDQLFFVSERKAAILREYRLAEGDIVFSRVADVGRSAVVTGAQSGWVISSNLMRIAVDRSIATPQYVQLVIAHYAPLREQIRKFTNASGREVVNDAIMRKLRLPWVPIPAQNRLLDIVGEFRGITACEETILTKLEILKQGLMNDLLMGRVQVTDDGLKSVGAG